MADITRADVASLIQEGYATTLLDKTYADSQVLAAFNNVSMGTKTVKMPVLTALPHAKWIGETAEDGVKPTDKAVWGNKDLVAEEVAVIVPVHENVIEDATEDVLADLAGIGGQAIAWALDAAVLFGTNKPTGWTSPDLFAAATTAGNLVAEDPAKADADIAGAIVGAAGMVAEDNFDPATIHAKLGLRYKLANLRNKNGTPIYQDLDAGGKGAGMLSGLNAYWCKGTVLGDKPVFDEAKALALVTDPSKVVIGVRKDITVKLLDQATVGGINLAERDMVALRFVARFGYALGDKGANGAPVAAVTPHVAG